MCVKNIKIELYYEDIRYLYKTRGRKETESEREETDREKKVHKINGNEVLRRLSFMLL